MHKPSFVKNNFSHASVPAKITHVYGKHAVEEAIKNKPQAIEKIFTAPYFDDVKILELIKDNSIATAKLNADALPAELARESDAPTVHQGIIASIKLESLVISQKEFLDTLVVTPKTALIILGELQDPHNVGAIIRSAAAFGISGIFIPQHNQAPVTGTVVKVSAGMAFRVPLISVTNINTLVRDLKEKGFWIYGLEGESKQSIVDEKFDASTVFILGNEAKGIRLKTRELCDVLLSIPMDPQCESLNVSASTAVALYAWNIKQFS